MKSTVVVIPTYNEVENLRTIVERTLKASDEVDVLVVDDNSPDGTGHLADQLVSESDRVHVLHRPGKEGLGVAYLAGFQWALDAGYQQFFEMDADGSHPPEKLPQMLALLKSYDIVVGSRWIEGGATENWPKSREMLSRSANLYARVMLGMPVHDATGGFRGFTRHALERIDLHAVASAGYAFQVDLLWRGLQAGLRAVETPITFTDRVLGDSKMSLDIALEGFRSVTGWGFARARRKLISRHA